MIVRPLVQSHSINIKLNDLTLNNETCARVSLRIQDWSLSAGLSRREQKEMMDK